MWRNIVFIGLFISILAVLVAAIPLRGLKTVSYIENRDLKMFPQITLNGLLDNSFQNNLEHALSDQLVFGENFKSIYNNIKSLSFKSTVSFYTVRINQDTGINNKGDINKNQQSLEVFKTSDPESLNNITDKDTSKVTENRTNTTMTIVENPDGIRQTDSYGANPDWTSITSSGETGPEVSGETSQASYEETSPAVPVETSRTSSQNGTGNGAAEESKPEKKENINNPHVHKIYASQYDPGYDKIQSFTIIPRGKGLLEIENTNHLLFSPVTRDTYLPLLEKRVKCYNTLVDEYPSVNFYMFYIESDVDNDILNQAFTHDIYNTYVSMLSPKIKHDKMLIQSLPDYLNNFYKTDHHWNPRGQYKGYKKVIRLIKGENEKLLDISVVQIDGLKTNGSKSRQIDDFSISEDFTFLWADLPPYDTYINGNEETYGKKHEYINGIYPEEEGFNHYGNCNGWDYGIIEYDFKQPEEENLLMFIDSFGNSMLEFVAAHFNKTYVVDLRYYKDENGSSFDFRSFITEKNIKTVLFFGPYYFHTNEQHLINIPEE